MLESLGDLQAITNTRVLKSMTTEIHPQQEETVYYRDKMILLAGNHCNNQISVSCSTLTRIRKNNSSPKYFVLTKRTVNRTMRWFYNEHIH